MYIEPIDLQALHNIDLGSVVSKGVGTTIDIGAAPESQLAQAISGQEQKPVKAFVVSSDVSTAQALDRNIVEQASIG